MEIKNHCYDLENLYNYYKSQVENGINELKDPVLLDKLSPKKMFYD